MIIFEQMRSAKNMNSVAIFTKNIKKNFHILYQLFLYLWREDKNIRFRIVLAIGFVISGIFLNLGVPLSLKYLVSSLERLQYPHFYIIVLLVIYGIIWTLSQINTSFKEICFFKVIERSVRRLNVNFMEHLNKLSFAFHTQRKTGDLTNALERAQSAIPILFYGVVFMIIPIMIEIAIAITIFWKMYGFYYSLILFIIFCVFIIFSIPGTKKILEYRQTSNKLHRKVSSIFVDSLLNFEVVRYFGRKDFELNNYDSILEQKEKAETKSLIILELMHVGHTLILGIGLITLTFLVCMGVLKGYKTVSDLVFVNSLVLQFFAPLSSFGAIFRSTYKAFMDIEYIFDILAITPEIKDIPDAKPLEVEKGHIEFKNVTFGYGSSSIILDNVSFTIPAGSTVAVVGTTGEGKSTISRLLYRFYDALSGEILIDEQNIKNVKYDSIANAIGIVPQDTILFNNTIGYNITYGKLEATQEEVEKVVKAVRLDRLINSLPEKYDTVVGERGLKLSGGEKQRIAIARLLLKNPPICIFDEPTSSLDVETEKGIKEIIGEVTKGKTSIIISHRASAITNVDKVFLLKNGKIMEQTEHDIGA
jgi:ATP-binding cassette, subfamily B, heavy metal transporter